MKDARVETYLATIVLLVACLGAGAQDIPAPPADMLPTADEIQAAPAFPFTDGTHPHAKNYRLPVEMEVTDITRGGDRVTGIVGGRPRPAGGLRTVPPASSRERHLMFKEFALVAPHFKQKAVTFHRVLYLQLLRYETAAQAAAQVEQIRSDDRAKGQPGTTLKIGDDAYIDKWNSTGRGDVYLYAQKGPWYILIRTSGVAAQWQDKLRSLLTYTAGVIVNKIGSQSGGGTTQSPVQFTITDGPSGDPNPVQPGAQVQCRVQATHSANLPMTYHWTATGGRFNDPTAAAPVWTAPPKSSGGPQEYGITVKITASDGSEVGASYVQQIGAVPDLRIDPAGILLHYRSKNPLMEIERAADKQCVVVQVVNDHPTARPTPMGMDTQKGMSQRTSITAVV